MSGANDSSACALPLPLRTLPHSELAERHVLACVLIDRGETLSECLTAGLSEGAFYSGANRTLFAELVGMHERGQPIDITVGS